MWTMVGIILGGGLIGLIGLLAYMAYCEEKELDRDLQKADKLTGRTEKAKKKKKDSRL